MKKNKNRIKRKRISLSEQKGKIYTARLISAVLEDNPKKVNTNLGKLVNNYIGAKIQKVMRTENLI